MKTNNLLIRLLVRLIKKYHMYDAFSLRLTIGQIINIFSFYKENKNLNILINLLIEDIIQVNSIKLESNKSILIAKDLNKILWASLYDNIIGFLNEKNIFISFNNNIKLYNSKNYKNFDEYIKYFKKQNYDIRSVIVFAFLFRETKEGHDYWLNIHKQYVLYINSLLI